MTRNTKLHRIKTDDQSILYRDLTVEELDYLDNIRNESIRNEMAGDIAFVKVEPEGTYPPWQVLSQIGSRALVRSRSVITDQTRYEITVREARKTINSTKTPLYMIGEILSVFPGQSITDLLKLTYRDLIEIVCLAESVSGKKILNVDVPVQQRRRGMRLVNPADLPDGGANLQKQMDQMASQLTS